MLDKDIKNLTLNQISNYHDNIISGLNLFFSTNGEGFIKKYADYTNVQISATRSEQINEAENSSCLTILAAIEAAFRIDYLTRAKGVHQDSLSIELRSLYNKKAEKAALEKDIFTLWKKNSEISQEMKDLISDLIGAFNFRHWLAHGRYWHPRFGRKYTYDYIYMLASNIFTSFDFKK